QIILMSASINSKELADYFALPVHNGLIPVCVFEVEGRPFAVEEYYLDDLKDIFDFQSLGEPAIEKKMYQVAVSLIQSFDEFEKRSKTRKNFFIWAITNLHFLLAGHLRPLLFYPFLLETTQTANTAQPRGNVYSFYSVLVSKGPGNKNQLLPFPNRMRPCTFISTLLFPSFSYLVVLKKILVVHKYFQILLNYKLTCSYKTLCHTSHEGRVTIILSSLQHCPLGATVLKLKKLDIGKPKALLATALSPPSVDDIERTIVQLKELGALTTCVQTEENLYDGELTFLGMVLTQLPVDLYLGKLIVLGHVFGCLEECLII
ncbi:TDRD9 helicase, partial [Oxylabes madagascariensis]|nr:TDRD9 helicase [Oxylabes madagascariensis]